MKQIALLTGALVALAASPAFADCQFKTTPQGRCVDQWGNIIPTDHERRYDASGVMRINLANEAAYSVDGQWYARPKEAAPTRQGGRAEVSTATRKVGP